jgi:hypothetical protein
MLRVLLCFGAQEFEIPTRRRDKKNEKNHKWTTATGSDPDIFITNATKYCIYCCTWCFHCSLPRPLEKGYT